MSRPLHTIIIEIKNPQYVVNHGVINTVFDINIPTVARQHGQRKHVHEPVWKQFSKAPSLSCRYKIYAQQIYDTSALTCSIYPKN